MNAAPVDNKSNSDANKFSSANIALTKEKKNRFLENDEFCYRLVLNSGESRILTSRSKLIK